MTFLLISDEFVEFQLQQLPYLWGLAVLFAKILLNLPLYIK